LGSLEFFFVPVFFIFGLSMWAHAYLATLAALYVVIFGGNLKALYIFSRFAPTTGLYKNYQKAVWSPEKVPILDTALCWPRGLTIFLTSTPTYCETLSLAYATGVAKATWHTGAQQALWVAGWLQTPFHMFGWVGHFTLPFVLTIVGFVGYVVHLVAFCFGVRKTLLKTWDSMEAGGSIAATAGVANLLLVSAAAMDQDSTSIRYDGIGLAALGRAFVKLLFGTKVSLLGVLMRVDENDDAIRPLEVAIAPAFGTSLRSISR